MRHLTLRAKLDLALTLLMLAMILAVSTRYLQEHGVTRRPSVVAKIEVPSEPIALKGAEILGNRAAPFAVVMYMNYGCGACRRFELETLPGIVTEYLKTGKILLAVQIFPLEYRDEASWHEAGLARCASRHGKFWEAHRVLFDHPQSLAPVRLEATARAIGLAPANLAQCAADAQSDTGRDVLAASRLGVRGTPAFFIGRLDEKREHVSVRVAHEGVSPGVEWFRQLLETAMSEPGDGGNQR